MRSFNHEMSQSQEGGPLTVAKSRGYIGGSACPGRLREGVFRVWRSASSSYQWIDSIQMLSKVYNWRQGEPTIGVRAKLRRGRDCGAGADRGRARVRDELVRGQE